MCFWSWKSLHWSTNIQKPKPNQFLMSIKSRKIIFPLVKSLNFIKTPPNRPSFLDHFPHLIQRSVPQTIEWPQNQKNKPSLLIHLPLPQWELGFLRQLNGLYRVKNSRTCHIKGYMCQIFIWGRDKESWNIAEKQYLIE